MNCYLVRHADKASGNFYNSNLRIQDDPISEKGRLQAIKLADYLADKNITAIYVSAYQRTLQTAEPLARRLEIEPVVDERLNELNNGLVGNMTAEEFSLAFPKEWRLFQSKSCDFRFPGGETGEEARDRILEFMTEKQTQHADENVMAVSHDGLIRLWMTHLCQMPVYWRADFQVDLCGITELRYQTETGRWKLIRYNQSCL
jgi:broad specificity phosphatase PhoE